MNNKDTRGAPIKIDKVRASKAGHAFHEAWAARTALELLPPSTGLTAITLEGFDERDEQLPSGERTLTNGRISGRQFFRGRVTP